MFLGSHANKVDAKGRLALPTDFRNALNLKSFQGFFCTPSLDGPFLECGGEDYMEGLKASIAALPPYDPDRQALQRALIGRARRVSIDNDGRCVLPQPMRAHAGLEGEALLMGLGDTFQIWRADAAAQQAEDEEERARAALRRLQNPAAFRPASG
ncbi:MAG: division/cell wall cluster transcriptional repressor MraZ [Parvularculaceae bacterium]